MTAIMEAEHMKSIRRSSLPSVVICTCVNDRATELNFGTGLGQYLAMKQKPVHGSDYLLKRQIAHQLVNKFRHLRHRTLL